MKSSEKLWGTGRARPAAVDEAGRRPGGVEVDVEKQSGADSRPRLEVRPFGVAAGGAVAREVGRCGGAAAVGWAAPLIGA